MKKERERNRDRDKQNCRQKTGKYRITAPRLIIKTDWCLEKKCSGKDLGEISFFKLGVYLHYIIYGLSSFILKHRYQLPIIWAEFHSSMAHSLSHSHISQAHQGQVRSSHPNTLYFSRPSTPLHLTSSHFTSPHLTSSSSLSGLRHFTSLNTK